MATTDERLVTAGLDVDQRGWQLINRIGFVGWCDQTVGQRGRIVRYTTTLLFIFAAGFVLFATQVRGPGLCPDSMQYLGAAESMSRGEAPLAPFAKWSQHASSSRLHHFPPGFSALIAVPTALGMGSAQAARVIEALLAGALAVLSSLIVASCLGATTATWPALFGGALVIITPAIVLDHLIVLSEPLFLTLYALTWVLMLRSPQRLWALGLVAAGCAMTRYAGVSVLVCVAVWTLARPGALVVRLARVFLVALPTLLCLSLWRRWAGDFRHYAWHGAGLRANFEEAWTTLCDWLVPLPRAGPWRAIFALSLLTLAASLLMAAARRATPSDPARVVDADGPLHVNDVPQLRAAALLVVTYLCVVLASRLGADPEIPFDWRILSPVMLTCELVAVVVFVRLWPSCRPTLRLATLLGASVWLIASARASWTHATNMRADGACYDAPAWQQSSLARWLRGAGNDYELYSNDPAAIWHICHRNSKLLPESEDPTTLRALSERLHARRSAIIDFPGAFEATLAPSFVAASVGLQAVSRLDRASVWTCDDILSRDRAGASED
jgi:hypothetical protein